MKRYTSFFVVSLSVLSISAADVFIINAKPSERLPLSVTIDRSLQTLQDLLGKKADQGKALDIQLLSNGVPKSEKDQRDRSLLRPASSRDLTKTNVADLLRLLTTNKNVKKPITRTPHFRLFRNMYGVPKKLSLYRFKKPKRPFGLDSSERLKPFLKFLITNSIPKRTFQDLTRLESNITEDYIDIGEIGRNNLDRYSRDYIDFDSLKFRRQDYPVKAALRTFSVESNEDSSSEATKSKRFEIIKNKHNKKDIKSTETDEVRYQKKKATFKKKSNKKKVISVEDAGTSLSSESKERIREKSKKRHKTVNKKKTVSQENDEWHEDDEIGYYLQGNKLTVYPPVEADSSDENDSDDTRRRGHGEDRLPYFLPKRYHWNMDDIHNLGYFYFDGPKGVSLER